MSKKTFFALSAAGVCVGAGCALSFFLASFTAGGKRQTCEEALSWQRAHYDLSWFDALSPENYTVTSYDGYVLHASLLRSPAPSDSYVILSHGYTDNKYGSLKYAKLYLDAGYNCILYDLRGHGANEKTFCTYSIREARDLHQIILDTRLRYGRDITIGLHGESLGASTTIAVLKYDQEIAFAVADCGFSEITNVLRVGIRRMHLPACFVKGASLASRLRYGYSYEQMRPIDSLKENKVPLLFLHGAEDDFIVPQNSRDMQEATSGYSRLYLIPGAGHAQSVLTAPELYREHVTDFLKAIRE